LKRKLIFTTLLVEYGMLELLAGALGSSAPITLTWAVSAHALKINWHFIPSVNLLGVETAKKPGQTLRQHGTAGTSAGTPPQVRC